LLQAATEDGQAKQGAALCAILSEGFRPTGKLTDAVDALTQGDPRLPKRLHQVMKQLLGKRDHDDGQTKPLNLGQWALSGFPDRLCRINHKGEGRMVGGRGVQLGETARNETEYIVAVEVSERGIHRTAAKVDLYLPVTFEDIEATLPVKVKETATYDQQKEMVRGQRSWEFHDLILKTEATAKPDEAACAQILAEVAEAQFDTLYRPDKDAARLQQRILFAAAFVDDPDWPDFTAHGICQRLPEALYGKRKIDDVRRLNWHDLFRTWLSWPQQQKLDQIAPAHIDVPSGSRIALDYSAEVPVLAVRLQEMFGQAETPTVAKGKVAVLMHLLAPNMRPCQVTQDLRNFWNTTYAEVRKELRQRYPKHSWPEDPWTAQAIRGAKRHKS
jgi:ATP-dependent helicase HrpB